MHFWNFSDIIDLDHVGGHSTLILFVGVIGEHNNKFSDKIGLDHVRGHSNFNFDGRGTLGDIKTIYFWIFSDKLMLKHAGGYSNFYFNGRGTFIYCICWLNHVGGTFNFNISCGGTFK